MIKPIHFETDGVGNVVDDIPASILAECRFVWTGAECSFHQFDSGYLIEQWYDSPDCFIGLLEVSCTGALTIPFCTNFPDLLVLQHLKGSVLEMLHFSTTGQRRMLRRSLLESGCYQLVCLPPNNTYAFRFSDGRSLVFYFVLKSTLLSREYSPEWVESIPKGERKGEKRLREVFVSMPRKMTSAAEQRISEFLRRPGRTYLQRLESQQQIAVFLLRQYLADQRLWAIDKKATKAELDTLKILVEQQIEDGMSCTVKLFAEQLDIDSSTLNARFRRAYGYSLKTFILHKKLSYARSLLASGLSVGDTATYLNWHRTHFLRLYKKQFGHSPSTYRKY